MAKKNLLLSLFIIIINILTLSGCKQKQAGVLFEAIKKGSLEEVKNLSTKVPLNVYDNNGLSPLHYALIRDIFLSSEKSYLEIAKYLIEIGININAKTAKEYKEYKYSFSAGTTPLHIICRSEKDEVLKMPIVELLLDKGADINARDDYGFIPLHFAVKGDSIILVKLLLDKGSLINIQTTQKCNNYPEKSTPLHIAVIEDKAEMAKLILKKGADFNLKDAEGSPVFHYARDNIEIAKILIENGVDINSKNNAGSTLLHLAVLDGNLEMVQFLINKGANLNATELEGSTPLYIAISEKQNDIVKLLIDKGANVNISNKNEDLGDITPLYLAIENKDVELTKLLVSKGANVNIVDKNGLRPLDLAKQLKSEQSDDSEGEDSKIDYDAIIEILTKAGAKANKND